MKIHIQSLEILAIMGILDFERCTKQRLVVDIELDYNYQKDFFINYAEVAQLVTNHIVSKEYFLLEEALLGLRELLIGEYEIIERISIKITKPDILSNAIVALSESW